MRSFELGFCARFERAVSNVALDPHSEPSLGPVSGPGERVDTVQALVARTATTTSTSLRLRIYATQN